MLKVSNKFQYFTTQNENIWSKGQLRSKSWDPGENSRPQNQRVRALKSDKDQEEELSENQRSEFTFPNEYLWV